jgi:CheY-like chemotaxis protein
MGNPNINVLIVDDNEMNRETLARRLKHEGFNFSMATNGREALEMVRSHQYHLILLDIMMPEMDGYTVLSRLKTNQSMSDIPVIMISAVEEMESVMKCMELGADDYLTKPFEPVLLKAAIARCLPQASIKSAPPAPPVFINAPRINLQSPKTTLQTSKTPLIESFELPEDTTQEVSIDMLTVDEIVLRILMAGRINRKAYLYLTKTLYNSIFSHTFNEQTKSQIFQVLDGIVKGRIQVLDKQNGNDR